MSDTVIEAPPSSATDVLSSLSPKQLGEWRLTGSIPEASSETDAPSSSPLASDSAPDTPEQAASTDAHTPPASEPGTSAAKPVSTKPKANAETRKAELNAEIQSLLKQRDELRAAVTAPPPQPAREDVKLVASSSTPPPLADAIARPDVTRPALSEGQFFEAYPEAAYGDFARYTARYEYHALRAEDQRTQADQARVQAIQAKAQAYGDRVRAAQADPDFTIDDRLLSLIPADFLPPGVPLAAEHVIAQEIMTSEVAPALLRHLSEHPDEFAALRALDSPLAISRAMGRLEARLDTSQTPNKPVVKTTTSAPTPPKTLGTKSAEPVDDVQAALASGDVRRYILAMNRKEAAS